MRAVDIDITKLNRAYKGCEFRVAQLYDIHDGGKPKGFALNFRPLEKKRFGNEYAPFYFEERAEADLACAKLNTWSHIDQTSSPQPSQFTEQQNVQKEQL